MAIGAAPLARRTRTITLEPIVVEAKIPAKPAGLPWKWILLGLAVAGGAYYLHKSSKKKRRGRARRPLAA